MSVVERLLLDPEVSEPEGLRARAAVAVIFGPDDALLLIRRAEREGDPWSGHMAFPGGRTDPGDPSTRHTAVRETWEEVALDLTDARYLGALPLQRSPVRAPRVDFGIFPYVFQTTAWPTGFAPNPEVAAVHRFEFRRFLEREGRDTFRYTAHGFDLDLPRVRLGGETIWGLTLRMLDDLVERVR